MKQGMDNEHFLPHSPALWVESRTSGRTTWCLNPEPVGETVSTRGGGLPSSSIAGRSLEGQICRTAEWYLWIVCFKVTLVLLKSAFSFSSWWHNTVIISHWWDSRLNNVWPHVPYKRAPRVLISSKATANWCLQRHIMWLWRPICDTIKAHSSNRDTPTLILNLCTTQKQYETEYH